MHYRTAVTPSLPSSDAASSEVSQTDDRQTHSLRLGATVFAQYFLLALDIRYVAGRNYRGIMIVNALIALMGWYVVRGIVQAHSIRERIAYVAGGASGAVLAAWLS